MGKRKTTRRPSRSPQVGDMRERVTLYDRNIKAPKFNSANFSEKYIKNCSVFASVIAKKGPPKFSGVNLDEQITITFIIRYRDDVTTETVIEFNNDHYKILDPDNAEKRNRFLFIGCRALGDKTKEANQ